MFKIRILFSFIMIIGVSSIPAQDDFSDESLSQTDDKISITGVVLDASSGKPIAGANVIVDDSELGAAADEDGKFSIDGVQSGSGVTASAIGYEDLTLYADQAELNFELKSENKLNLNSVNADFNLLCLPTDNFPTFADEFEGQEISKLRVGEIARLGMLRTFQQTRIYPKMN